MTDKPFRYDDKLLNACANSPLARTSYVTNDNDHKVDELFFSKLHKKNILKPCHSNNQTRYNNNHEKQTTTLFVVSPFSSSSTSTSSSLLFCEELHEDDFSCTQLLNSHAKHYDRSCFSPDTKDDCSFEKVVLITNELSSVLKQQQKNHQQQIPLETKLDYHYYYRVGARMKRFLDRVQFINDHNNNNKKRTKSSSLYHVTLNRFSDIDPEMIFPSSPQFVPNDNDEENNYQDHFDGSQRVKRDFSDVFTYLTEANIIKEMGDLLGHGKKKKRKEKEIEADLMASKHQKLRISLDDYYVSSNSDDDEPSSSSTSSNKNIRLFQFPQIDNDLQDGTVLSIKAPYKKDGYKFQRDETIIPDRDPFVKHLNWATTSNPDGVAIVHDVFDQGDCGSCWAYVATGSLEASLSRQQAYEAYHEFIYNYLHVDRGKDDKDNIIIDNDSVDRDAIHYAQIIEREVFNIANLSIQELIDCDIDMDQGCIGGNPLLAFYYIHKNGLTTWENYPYVGYQELCKRKLNSKHAYYFNDNDDNDVVAKVRSWGLISSDHENHMELVLRYIGPIAVGIYGGNDSFLNYGGGIFNDDDDYDNNYYDDDDGITPLSLSTSKRIDQPCYKKRANHALLIVGYGQEEIKSDNGVEVVKYWIARNSWGKGWGENGYVRIKRGFTDFDTNSYNNRNKNNTASSSREKYGVCGLARSPTVALGGKFLYDRTKLISLYDFSNNDSDTIGYYQFAPRFNNNRLQPFQLQNQQQSSSSFELYCSFIGRSNSSCARFMRDNWALILGTFCIICSLLLAVWPLTHDCRQRRRRRRRMRESHIRRENEKQRQSYDHYSMAVDEAGEVPRETSSLFSATGGASVVNKLSCNNYSTVD